MLKAVYFYNRHVLPSSTGYVRDFPFLIFINLAEFNRTFCVRDISFIIFYRFTLRFWELWQSAILTVCFGKGNVIRKGGFPHD